MELNDRTYISFVHNWRILLKTVQDSILIRDYFLASLRHCLNINAKEHVKIYLKNWLKHTYSLTFKKYEKKRRIAMFWCKKTSKTTFHGLFHIVCRTTKIPRESREDDV